jgi:hypothetical protein
MRLRNPLRDLHELTELIDLRTRGMHQCPEAVEFRGPDSYVGGQVSQQRFQLSVRSFTIRKRPFDCRTTFGTWIDLLRMSKCAQLKA